MWMAPLKTASGTIPAAQAVLQIEIALLRTKPPIWRRVLVPAEFTLEELHHVVQTAMGWENCHLHQFYIGKQRFGVPNPSGAFMGGSPTINETKTCLANLLNGIGSKATYIYDFGDSWEHSLTVEKILPAEPGIGYPLCTGGKLAGPPEDCGGIPGFYHMLEALADPNHEDHDDMRDWIESFDPEAFSIEAVNQRLRRIFLNDRQPKRSRATKPKAVLPQLDPEDLQAAHQAIEASFEQLRGKQRRRIRLDEEVPLELSDHDRELILEHVVADEDLLGRLRVAPSASGRTVFHFTLDDLDELAGCVAFEVNHVKDKKLQKQWDAIFARISDVFDSYIELDE